LVEDVKVNNSSWSVISAGKGIIRITGRGSGSLHENSIETSPMEKSIRRKFIIWLIYIYRKTKVQNSYLDVRLIFLLNVRRFGKYPEKRISAFKAKPVIIRRLPAIFSPFSASIFPVSAMPPPVIIAIPLLVLLVLNPKSPAAVGIINAPEKIVRAINSDWMMDCTCSERIMLNVPIISIMALVFRSDFF
jgi:hypothetical protein